VCGRLHVGGQRRPHQGDLADCDATKLPEIWSLNNRDNFEGATDGQSPDGTCFNVDWTTQPPSVVITNGIAGNASRVAGTQGKQSPNKVIQ
jgi:hypothetical protein